jgi:uncharacterized protein
MLERSEPVQHPSVCLPTSLQTGSRNCMEFLFYCRDKPNVTALLERLAEAHWSFMDRYHDRLLVRGPTLSHDGQKHTGSLHIVRLGDVAETDTFAYQEPFYKAGCYGEVIIRRWQDELGRVMRDFKQNGDDPLFLTLSTGAVPPDLPARYRDRFATYGRTAASCRDSCLVRISRNARSSPAGSVARSSCSVIRIEFLPTFRRQANRS